MNDVAVALIAGLAALAAAVVGLVGVLAARNEPRVAKELAALNSIIDKLPAGEARHALESRRTRVAIAYGSQREPLGVFTVAYMYVLGGYLIAVVASLVLGGDAGAWQSLFQSVLGGLVFGGIIFALIGVALFIIGLVFKIRDWLTPHNSQSSVDVAPDPTVPANQEA
ncbi:hypothetical protein JOD63_000702 [Microbacterium terrae]|uniref:Uncharacterized protein n=1 Tax=Microbacterium terrae TaxID=69369 RepID=A0A0M2HE86_9MICO|nr:hypothetical protein [Microbacterium terrae]KJL44930.1 hypothetical protein RS81_00398 [Microbacterium terrae]MBP1076734.1 hypothetical protein [Microbacterium terrae]GLJ97565.1 hypothetical protein GCM10017594_07620 [Microbacterium terrae]